MFDAIDTWTQQQYTGDQYGLERIESCNKRQPVGQLIYARAIAKLVAEMSVERAAQVYDFARFLQARPANTQLDEHDDDDWLNDTEEQMQAEDALWDAAYVRQGKKFATLREAAHAEIEAGTT